MGSRGLSPSCVGGTGQDSLCCQTPVTNYGSARPPHRDQSPVLRQPVEKGALGHRCWPRECFGSSWGRGKSSRGILCWLLQSPAAPGLARPSPGPRGQLSPAALWAGGSAGHRSGRAGAAAAPTAQRRSCPGQGRSGRSTELPAASEALPRGRGGGSHALLPRKTTFITSKHPITLAQSSPQGCSFVQQLDRYRIKCTSGPQPRLPLPGARAASPPLGALWLAAAGPGALLQPNVKLGEALMCESCWLLPLPLVPLLKLLPRDRALSEAEVGRPLEGDKQELSSSAGGGPLRRAHQRPVPAETPSPGAPGPSPGGQQLGTGMSQDVPAVPAASGSSTMSESPLPHPRPKPIPARRWSRRSRGATGALCGQTQRIASQLLRPGNPKEPHPAWPLLPAGGVGLGAPAAHKPNCPSRAGGGTNKPGLV